MAWNDERVDLLKKLWADGLSASQIAGRLGGVTRNAVIGKVHRLGLSGRATTSRMKSHRPRVRAQTAKRLMKPRFATIGNPALRQLYLGDTEPYTPPAEELVIPMHERKYIQTLDGGLLPLADRRSSAAGFPLLRQEEGGRPALLRGACTARLPAAAAAPPRPRGVRAGHSGRRRRDGADRRRAGSRAAAGQGNAHRLRGKRFVKEGVGKAAGEKAGRTRGCVRPSCFRRPGRTLAPLTGRGTRPHIAWL